MSGEEFAMIGGGHETHQDCAPLPHDVKEVLEKGEEAFHRVSSFMFKLYILGPKGPDGKAIRKLIDYFSSRDPHFVIEMRPNKRIQANKMGKTNK